MTNVLEHPGDGDVPSGWRWSTSNLVLVFVFFFSLSSRYRWLPSRRGGVSGFGVPPASMRRAADQNGGGGRHNWGQGFRLGDQWGAALGLPTNHAKQMTVSSQYWARLMTKFLLPFLDLTHAECSLSVQDDIFKSWRKIQVFLKFHDFHSSSYCYEEQISAVQFSKLTHFLVSSLLPFPSE